MSNSNSTTVGEPTESETAVLDKHGSILADLLINSDAPNYIGAVFETDKGDIEVIARYKQVEVTENSFWRHSSGLCYRVLMIVNKESDNPKYPVTVVYRGTNGKIWSRHLSDWHRSMTFIET